MVTNESFQIPLRGPAGEPVDLLRTITSHGLASLPPLRLDEDAPYLEVTLPIAGGRPRTVVVRPAGRARATVEIKGGRAGPRTRAGVEAGVRRVLNLSEDLSGFYVVARTDPDLSWVASGAGRMVRGVTVFEDVVKTICTTNCSWGLTKKMVAALVEHLGEPAARAAPTGPEGRAFPTPQAMAEVDEAFYRDVVRAGYRAPYFRSLARLVADGDLDFESLATIPRDELSDEGLSARLQSLPGVGPYAAASIMMVLGRHSRLILDSWTRPKFARVAGMRSAKDATIVRRFKRYGDYAGLAFWLFLTKDWITDESPTRDY
ncbi:MAG: Fe-S cluster assembly protein HesB [Actinomycetota bacterium]|nr:Fe-S cluster assembly protein HesB [Actinomycetota bacterium]